tara:strand:- start:1542 stop:1820 length:279 start_codon:yes stop_codon:yes gene_type:complete
MPAIYSFSLDYKYDNDIIVRLESMKNRSSWIRNLLRQELDHERLQILVEVLYSAYKTQMDIGSPRDPTSLYQFREKADKIWASQTNTVDEEE